MNEDLQSAPNIGPVTEKQLRAVGIASLSDLERIGAKEAFMMIRKDVDHGACLHLLYALAGAGLDTPKASLSPHIRKDLRTWYRGLEHEGA